MERLYWNNDWKFAETWEEAMKEAVYPENEMEDVRLEMSSCGKGGIREPFVEAILYDGAKTLDFRYEDAVITGEKDALDGLPGSYGSVGEVQQAETVLIPAFGGTGYDENVRYFPDFASRLYLMDCNL